MLALALILAAANPLQALVDDHWGQARARARAAAAAKASRGEGPPPVLSLRPDGPVYRLPVRGQVMHERVEPGSGLTAIGLLLASKPGAPAVAPAAGRVAYGGHFRRYGEVLILDHGHGWTTVLTGLSAITVEQGASLVGGQDIGRAGERLRIQLLHHGRVADLPAMLAQLD